ncbi:hypothetical protein GCM10007897_44810 [Sphingobium jiangsuense]|uniref:DNA-binding transcriptional regulator YiaG n=1 Tax=Sphingobium jiangsuense TaxID=870476 RepID=A0A7W6BPD3_9SPHN|nr:transcriptional regulator [Sphingobium jiangsuense]MBB3928892.1 DNA-binding transcriptional regulator YiaG [Sphingobium jiangsuense]GLT03040.1 hypothetical protein GCM10007897_44810 [Sphingobium jiangsuense]
MAYHYKESGLDNVFLENGYTVHQTPYGEGVSIHDTEGLHRLIGEQIVAGPKRINGAEFRFLRLAMELSQRNIAAIIGSEEQTVRRWEKCRNQPVNGPADRLIRLLYTEYVGGNVKIRDAVDRLAKLDQIDRTEIRLREDHDHWRAAA